MQDEEDVMVEAFMGAAIAAITEKGLWIRMSIRKIYEMGFKAGWESRKEYDEGPK